MTSNVVDRSRLLANTELDKTTKTNFVQVINVLKSIELEICSATSKNTVDYPM